ncbi:MAG: FHA domain-containing protein [Proteobacteria bacterium]|nr:FHA domain-containing protein [Pseudomonadota bacterium]
MSHDDAPYLTFMHRGREAFRVRLHRRLLIGRGHACDVHLPDTGAEVSRKHAILTRRRGRIVVEDVSRFGTFVDGVPVGPGGRDATPGSEVRIGTWGIRVDDPGSPRATETRPPWKGDSTRSTDLIGESPAFLALLGRIRRIAPVKLPLLIEGETGTGKERVARATHRWSGRAGGPFEAINCGAIPDGTAHSELFGHSKGAFTGATADRAGIFERADGGTVFLDEVGELTASHQALLLRVLEERTVTRMGDAAVRPVDFRLVAATHVDLAAAVVEGSFRQDLLYRLRVAHVEVPPLRDRTSDIELLARHFLETASPTPPPALSDEALGVLRRHDWPGNVRELRNAMQQAWLNCNGPAVEPHDLPSTVVHRPAPNRPRPSPFRTSDERLRDEVTSALEAAGGNRTRAARILGCSRSTLYDRIRRLWPPESL